MRLIIFTLMLLLAGCGSAPISSTESGISSATEQRVASWRQLVDSGRNWSEQRQLEATNDFINQNQFVDDIIHWGKEDYWATPLQTIVTEGGDCEDFAVAKYFTLTEMGMSADKLRLTYVKALTLNQAHMVVSYYPAQDATPLVLDNLDPVIRPATQRNDLLPVYSFNAEGLWLNKQQNAEYVNDSSRLSLWQQLLRSMNAEAADESFYICRYQHYDLPSQQALEMCR
ncbi:MAG: transglutaminase-like cysteine peptidase [Methylophaga sp.]|nr:transglutaminase-like cysteine peptidase [Methylophaga sp.]